MTLFKVYERESGKEVTANILIDASGLLYFSFGDTNRMIDDRSDYFFQWKGTDLVMGDGDWETFWSNKRDK